MGYLVGTAMYSSSSLCTSAVQLYKNTFESPPVAARKLLWYGRSGSPMDFSLLLCPSRSRITRSQNDRTDLLVGDDVQSKRELAMVGGPAIANSFSHAIQ